MNFTITPIRPEKQSSEHINHLAMANFMAWHSLANVPPIGNRQNGQRICHIYQTPTEVKEKENIFNLVS